MLTATVCAALSAAGLAVAFLTAWRRRFQRAARIAGWSLLPIGLYMTGLFPLGQKIGRAVGAWAADLVFKPAVWAGMGVLLLSVLLLLAARIAGRRPRRRFARLSEGGASAASAPALGPGRAAARAGTGEPRAAERKKDDGLSDFKEIEDILRRRGI